VPHLRRQAAAALVLTGVAAASLTAATTRATAAPAHANVVGGAPATAGAWPSTVFVATWITNTGYAACTGSVIAPTIILTAAHCVVDETSHKVSPVDQIEVITGRQDLGDKTTGQVLTVASVHVSPSYDIDSGFSDAAYLVLSAPTTAPPITLATDADAPLLKGGHEAQIAGWGNTHDGQTGETTVLNDATVPLRSDSYCGQHFAGFYYPTAMVCSDVLGTHGVGPCFGDSGGPLVITDSAGQTVLAGITSRGNKDTCKSSTAEYTRVSSLAGWLSPLLAGAAEGPAPEAKPLEPLVAAMKPHNVSRPFITGEPRPNGALTCHAGSWQNTNGGKVRYAWLYNGRLQAGVTSPMVRLQKSVHSGWATCIVRVENAAGSSAARSKGVQIHR
jgi:secreted trypsin-like serine protease